VTKPEHKIKELKTKVETKITLTDYDLGVLNTLKWLLGEHSPYDGRVERA
jgi:hypothetical protein